MRVIAGTYRSRLLAAPRGLDTRPTSDRLRETLFNVLAPRIEGAVFADLYSGSGAVGIEAISRGARMVHFAEKAPTAIACMRSNLESLGIRAGYTIETPSVAACLRRLLANNIACDIVFLDPPYERPDEYSATLSSLGGNVSAVLAPDAIVIAEHRRKTPLAERYGNLARYRILEQGDATLSFYRASAD
jgi:16S rRNA (guanine966-N2)-methyltransferase